MDSVSCDSVPGSEVAVEGDPMGMGLPSLSADMGPNSNCIALNERA